MSKTLIHLEGTQQIGMTDLQNGVWNSMGYGVPEANEVANRLVSVANRLASVASQQIWAIYDSVDGDAPKEVLLHEVRGDDVEFCESCLQGYQEMYPGVKIISRKIPTQLESHLLPK